ncbi:MAG: hypothetical protein PF636_01940 [Actinomycetota bacterium]|jgi:hypothetical protein|nr:hypothetical protein [Actinomycetota bacterium]
MAMLPPTVVNVRIREPDSRGFRIWLPLFLLWPLLLLIIGSALTVSIVVDFVGIIVGARYHDYTRLLLGCMQILAETRGTHAHVHGHDDNLVDIDIY